MSATPIVAAEGETPAFSIGEQVRACVRFPLGHFRLPNYIRGKCGVVEDVIRPKAVNNEEEGYRRNAGSLRHYYRVSMRMTEIWPSFEGQSIDSWHIEVFENWWRALRMSVAHDDRAHDDPGKSLTGVGSGDYRPGYFEIE